MEAPRGKVFFWVLMSSISIDILHRGLGYLLNFAQNTFNASLMMASLVIIVGFILLIFSGLKVVEEKLTPWRVPAT